ncbi:peptide ABC transporter permease [Clostridium botulinum]|uniref:ABC transporter permease n=1 Tax=Clostridium botulinum TaxID=1491 RepID=UPI0006A7291F|nr:ABC transporter permease [Clostridium botulinum]KOM98145.1 peptide ABC transporter permease [Clostridium botulinum]KOM99696.1 peptide ABC transporter permease [Clostridium botulinum]MBY7005906.1 ABC transporter permease [Clostridium botulinum]MCR1148291.1 ABC transporter permease [Clostridium botulinum]NFH94720.1 ABC transporter permease [Clostridium botulinum]
MFKYILKRLGYMLLTLWIVITITFVLMHTIPGDPLASSAKRLPPQIRANYYAKYGLDKPLTTQYAVYMKNLLKGDLGDSLAFAGRSVNTVIKDGLPASARIGIQAVFLGFTLGIILGVVAAFKRNKWPDYIVMFLALIGVSIPSFVFAALLQYIFTVKFMILPTTGWDGAKYTILPTIALSLSPLAIYARYMRNECLDVLGQDYILTAKAKGVSKVSLAWKHIIRNAILPSITILGPQIATILTGSFVIEGIYGIPGLGSSFVGAVNNMDYSMIMGLTVFMATLYIFSLLIVDILYGIIDPRIRITNSK